jgi:cell division protein FtsX
MNAFITSIFSGIVSSLHFLVVGGLIALVIKYHQVKEQFVSVFGNIAQNDEFVYTIIFVLFLFYVFTMGLLSTIISINENLNEINSNLKMNKQ